MTPNELIPLWETKDGQHLRIDQMEDGHLINSILKIKTSPILWRLKYLPTLEAELKRRFPNEKVP